MKKLLTITALTLLTFVGCAKLDTAGVYKGDKVLYNAEVQIPLVYDAVHDFVIWEYKNHARLVKEAPSVIQTANAIRKNAEFVLEGAVAVRDAYVAAPTITNQDNLNKALASLQEVLNQIATYQATNQPTK